MNVYLYPSNTETELKNAYIGEYHEYTFDFQNDGLQGGTLNYNSSYANSGCDNNGIWVNNKRSSYAQGVQYIFPSSVYNGRALKNIKLYGYLPNASSALQIQKSGGVCFRYRQDNNSTNIGFADGGSGAYNLGNYTGEMVLDVDFESGKVSGTCAGASFTINSSYADTIMGYWTEGTLVIGLSVWFHTSTAYIRKVVIKTE